MIGSLLILLLIVLLLALVVSLFTRQRAGALPTDPEPRCGKCGYIVRGIPSLTCPECGSDLREVGIDVGKRSRSRGWILLIVLLLLWSGVMAACTPTIQSSIDEMLPHWRRIDGLMLMLQPKSGAYRSIAMTVTRIGKPDANPQRWSSDSIIVQLSKNDGSSASLIWFVDGLSQNQRKPIYRYYAIDHEVSGPAPILDIPLILNWLRDEGVSIDAQVTAEASEAAVAVSIASNSAQQYRNGSSSTSGGVYRNFGYGRENWIAAPINKPWNTMGRLLPIALWILGLWWIARRFTARRISRGSGEVLNPQSTSA